MGVTQNRVASEHVLGEDVLGGQAVKQQRVLSVYLPHWSVDRMWRRRRALNKEARNKKGGASELRPAVLLVSLVAGHQVVVRCCELGARSGVVEGVRLAEAYALLRGREVCVAPFDARDDLNALHALARWATKFSPVVEVDPPHGLLLGTHGCERLFGGEDVLAHTLLGDLRRMGFKARIALASTVGCAWGMARFSDERFANEQQQDRRVGGDKNTGGEVCVLVAPGDEREAMRQLPIEALRLDGGSTELLGEMGVERIEHLFPIPRTQLVSRFGESFVERMDEAFGARPDSVSFLPVQDPLWERFRFSNDVIDAGGMGDIHALIDVVMALLNTLLARVEERNVAVGQFDLTMRCVQDVPLEHSDDGVRSRDVGVRTTGIRTTGIRDPHIQLLLARPSVDAHHLGVLLRTRMESLRLTLGVEQVTLAATRVYPQQWLQQTLLPVSTSTSPVPASPMVSQEAIPTTKRTHGSKHRTSKALGVLLDRLIDHCGDAARIVRMEVLDTHIPERAYTRRSVLDKGVLDKRSGGKRVDEPHPLGGFDLVADRPTNLFSSPEVLMSLVSRESNEPNDQGEQNEIDKLHARGIRRPPEQFRWRGVDATVLHTEGPERIGAPWWDVPRTPSVDAGYRGASSISNTARRSLAYRDYFRVYDDFGRCLWIYYSSEARRWFVHGMWA